MSIVDIRRRAIVIGISEYDKLQPLTFCKNDGQEMYELLISLEYKITDNNNLTGYIKWDKMRDAIFDFFSDMHIKSERKTKSLSPHLEKELWDCDALLCMIKYKPYKRNKAALALLWDLDARPHEVIYLR
jgi:hypothetical protein